MGGGLGPCASGRTVYLRPPCDSCRGTRTRSGDGFGKLETRRDGDVHGVTGAVGGSADVTGLTGGVSKSTPAGRAAVQDPSGGDSGVQCCSGASERRPPIALRDVLAGWCRPFDGESGSVRRVSTASCSNCVCDMSSIFRRRLPSDTNADCVAASRKTRLPWWISSAACSFTDTSSGHATRNSRASALPNIEFGPLKRSKIGLRGKCVLIAAAVCKH